MTLNDKIENDISILQGKFKNILIVVPLTFDVAYINFTKHKTSKVTIVNENVIKITKIISGTEFDAINCYNIRNIDVKEIAKSRLRSVEKDIFFTMVGYKEHLMKRGYKSWN